MHFKPPTFYLNKMARGSKSMYSLGPWRKGIGLSCVFIAHFSRPGKMLLYFGTNTYRDLNVHRYKGSIPNVGFDPSTVYLDFLSLFVKENLYTLYIFISHILINISND